MRFISYTHQGIAAWGVVDGSTVTDQTEYAPDLKSALAKGLPTAPVAGATVPLSDVTLLPVVPNPDKVLCVGHNYEAHRVETGRDKTKHPSIFTRFADTLIGANDPIYMPRESTSLDYEAELAIVIGKGGRRIAEADAMDHVAGFSCFNDGSVRDFQWHTGQFTPGKNFPDTAPFGPELVTQDEIEDMDAVCVQSILNGEVMQSATLDHMIFPVVSIIAYVSTFTTLNPGDVIATGTPGGVGAKRTPPVWMKDGDEIVINISGVGRLTSIVKAEG